MSTYGEVWTSVLGQAILAYVKCEKELGRAETRLLMFQALTSGSAPLFQQQLKEAKRRVKSTYDALTNELERTQ